MKVLCHAMREDPNDHVRLEAARTFAEAGRAAIHYVSELLQVVMNDPSVFVKQTALDAIVMLSSSGFKQLAAALECSNIEICRHVVKSLMPRIVDLLEVESESRKPIIAGMVKQKVEAQEAYFAAKRQQKQEERKVFRKE